MNIRYDFAALIDETPSLTIDDLKKPPVIAIDECCDHPMIQDMAIKLLLAGYADRSTPLWNQRRVRKDGSILYVLGGLSKTDIKREDCDQGVSQKGARWDDQMVLHLLLGNLYHRNPVVLLSENTKMDRFGLRRLLREVVAPALSRRADDHLAIIALFKKGKTSYEDYCRRVVEKFVDQRWRTGYDEYLI